MIVGQQYVRTTGETVETWDIPTATYTRTESGMVVETRPFTAEETDLAASWGAVIAERETLAALAAGVADLQDALTVAQADIADATTRATQATAFADATRTQGTAVAAWSPTAAGATDLATLRARTVADLTTVRGAVADVLDRIATLGDAVHELYAARALHGQGIALAYRDLIGLAGLAAREIRS